MLLHFFILTNGVGIGHAALTVNSRDVRGKRTVYRVLLKEKKKQRGEGENCTKH